MGKTATALRILYDEKLKQIFQNACYFVPCDAAMTPHLLITIILQVLHVEYGAKDNSLNVLHQHLESSHPLLLVLDNFETPWEESDAQSQIELILSTMASVSHV